MSEQTSSTAGLDLSDDEVVPIVEEIAHVSKRNIVNSIVRVRTSTETIEQIAQADLSHDDIEVTRVTIDKVVEVAPKMRTEGDVTIVPVLEEVLFVETRLVLKEEIHIRRRTISEHVSTPIKLRRQHAVIERDGVGVDLPTDRI